MSDFDYRRILDDAKRKRAALDAFITALEQLLGGETIAPIGDTKRLPREARPTPAPTETQERILTALKTAGEPVSPGELAKAVKMDVVGLRYHTKALIAAGAVLATGTTMSRRLSLA